MSLPQQEITAEASTADWVVDYLPRGVDDPALTKEEITAPQGLSLLYGGAFQHVYEVIVIHFRHYHAAAYDSDSRYRLKYAFAISYDVLCAVNKPNQLIIISVRLPAYGRARHGGDNPRS